mgnify:CR=1 FL=1
MGTNLSRQQLAQRIQALLQRDIEHVIDVDRMLADARYARDVLLVCEAVPGGELVPLAALFREASRPAPGQAMPPGHAPLHNDWGRDTSGFGVSQPPPMPGAPAPVASRRASDTEPAPLAPPRRSWLPRWRGNK